MKRILSTLLVIALAIPLFVNCKKDKGVPVESFSIDPVTVYLNDGDTHQLDVIVQPGKAKKGEFMSSLVWVSDDENIASVDENGLVTAKMRGNTRITASTSDGTLSASCDVNVQLVLTDDKDISAYFEGNFALALRNKGLIADNKITYGEVKNITEFDVPALYVKDIETAGGLEFLVNLESLDLGGAKNLTSLNVSTLTKLKKLVATKGKLTHVDLTNCSDLESVFMDDNKLESVVFGQHPNLAKVSMNTNKLKEFNASTLPGLVYLDLAENELESIDLTGCKLIETLWLNNNKLKSIDAGSLEKLQLQGFRFFFNPGENGVLNVKDSKNSMTLWSWQMIKGDESSRVKGTLYCENSPKIKTQPKPEIAAKTGVPFSVSVEMESTGNYQYYWCLSAPVEVGSTGLTSYSTQPISDGSDGTYYISGSNTNTLTVNVGSPDIFVLLACMIYDEATGTTTVSDFSRIKYE